MNKSRIHDLTGRGRPLFGAASNLPKAEKEAAEKAVETAGEAAFQFDPVKVEIERWEYLSPEEIAPFKEESGLIIEFKMMWHMRKRFPLHFVVFKQVSSHLPHEANRPTWSSTSRARASSPTPTWRLRFSASW